MTAAAAGAAVVTGLRRGCIELRQDLTSLSGLLPLVWFPGLLGANLVFHAVVGLASALTVDREDGTLLRARAIPFGVVGHLVARVVGAAGTTAAGLVIFMVPAAFVFDDVALRDPAAWLRVAGVLALGLAAMLPLGALLAAAARSYQALTVLTLPVLGLLGISGVFYPLTALADWVQAVGQAFPVYWVGLGMRAALLPDAAAEVGGSWRPGAMVVVLLLWAVAGFAAAPALLRRMARRTSARSLRKGPVGAAG